MSKTKYAVQEFLPGDVIFLEGARGNAAYLLKEGKVEISTMQQEQKVVVAELLPGQIFGEMALLLDKHKRTATATVVERAEMVVIPRTDFDAYIKDSPLFIAILLKTLVGRLKLTTRQSTQVPDAFGAVCRILNLFVFMKNVEIPFQATLEDIAAALLISEDKVYRVLSVLEDSDILEIYDNDYGEKVIRIRETANFLENTRKARKTFYKHNKL